MSTHEPKSNEEKGYSLSSPVVIQNISKFLSELPEHETGFPIPLFRGQSGEHPLLPAIARPKKKGDAATENTSSKENAMLRELRRRGGMYIDKDMDAWELLVHAQHFGMKTRLLDWTSNPLAALWFACKELQKDEHAHVYACSPDFDDMLSDSERVGGMEDGVRIKPRTPFQNKERRTKVFKPLMNNPRIVAQHGWFTAHTYNTEKSAWIPLEKNTLFKGKIKFFRIPKNSRTEIIRQLNVLGVNDATMMPDLEGLCRNLNVLHNA